MAKTSPVRVLKQPRPEADMLQSRASGGLDCSVLNRAACSVVLLSDSDRLLCIQVYKCVATSTRLPVEWP